MRKKVDTETERKIAVKVENSFQESSETEPITLEELEKELEKDIKTPKKRSFLWLKILLIGIFIICLSIFLTVMPQLEIVGPLEITLDYNQVYEEEGAIANYLGKNITNKITIHGNVDITKVGKYKIKYVVKYGMFRVSKVRVVRVVDRIPPVITLSGNKEETICPNTEYKEAGYQAIDEYDGDITEKVKVQTTEDKIIYTVKDSSKNEYKIERTIVKEDKKAPEIKLKGSKYFYVLPNTSFQEPGYTVTDNCDSSVTNKVKVSGTVDVTKEGIYPITYTVTDENKNTSQVTRNVFVTYKTDPESGESKPGVIYLTFDDGPNGNTTTKILDVLKEENVKATFFVTNNGPDSVIKRAYNEGHSIGLHTASHDYSEIYKSKDNYLKDLTQIAQRVKRVTGIDTKLLRFPGGSNNTISKNYSTGIMSELTEEVFELGYRYYDWNVDASDAWLCAKNSVSNKSDCVYQNVTSGLRKDRPNIVLMHDVKSYTADALKRIIEYGKSNGYTFEAITTNTKMIRFKVNN